MLVGAVALGCGGDSAGPRVAASLEAIGLVTVSGVVGTTLPGPFSVRVLDSRKKTLSGAAVRCVVESGGGSVAFSNPASIADGTASCGTWTLGTHAGTQVLAVNVGSVTPVRFTATATAGAPTHFALVGPPPQTIRSGVQLQLVLQAADAFENPVTAQGIGVSLSVANATVSGASTTSDASGRATFANLRINGTVGPRTLTFLSNAVSIPAPQPIAFSLTAGVSSALAILQPPPALVSMGVAIAPAPRVQLRDADGNDVAEAGVALAASVSGATVSSGSALTDAQGTGTFTGLAIAGTPGAQTLTFAASGVTATTSVAFQLIEIPAVLAIETSIASVIQTAVIIAPAPLVSVRGTLGTVVPVAGVIVTAATAAPGVTLSGATATTDATGRARFTSLVATGASGSVAFTFSAAGLASVTAPVVTLQDAPVDPVPASIEFGVGAAKVIIVDPAQAATLPTPLARNAAGIPLPGSQIAISVRGPAIASVSSDGQVTGLVTGRTTIIASPTAAPTLADSVVVHVTRTATGPLVRTDLTAFALNTGTDVDVRVFFDTRTAGAISALTLDVAYPRNSPGLMSVQSVTATANTAAVSSPTAGLVRLVYVNSTGQTGLVELARIRFRTATSTPNSSEIVLTPLQVIGVNLQDLTSITTPINPFFAIRP